MKNVLIFAATLMTIGCGTKNACEELQDELCSCDGIECEEGGEDPADATDDEIEMCQAILDAGDVCGDSFDTGM